MSIEVETAVVPRSEPPTVADVARTAGVSTATVSRTLNTPDLVAGATRVRVESAIKELGYRPNVAARLLAGARTDTLGLILPELSGPFYSELLAGIEEVARASGYHLLVAATEPDDTAVPKVQPFDQTLVDGTIILPHALDNPLVDRLARSGRPMVLVEREGVDLPSVMFDGYGGARAIVEHLLVTHGCRAIACLAGPDDSSASQMREAGWRDALAAAGVVAPPEWLVRGSWSERDGESLAADLIARSERVEAIFAVNDEMAVGAMRGLARVGSIVPDDVRVVGYDDVPLAVYVRPQLTTVAAPPRVLGRTAAEVLISVMSGAEPPSARRLPTNVVVRSSCGCPQQEEEPR